MDLGKSVLAILLLSILCYDLYDFFSTHRPPISSNYPLVFQNHSNSNHLNHTISRRLNQTQLSSLNQTHQNDTMRIEFVTFTSYRGATMSVKLLTEDNFPGVNVTLCKHHPDWTKYIATKLITTAQVLIIMIVMAGKHIFLYMKMSAPPRWYHPLDAHKFAAIAIPWLIGCIAINYLQNTEPFSVFLNGELVFSKQLVGRFPRATEMKEIIRSRLAR